MSIMAIDQYGQTFHDLGKHPRKALLERLGATHAEKMYAGDNSGVDRHVGYIIARLRLTLYTVEPFTKPA